MRSFKKLFTSAVHQIITMIRSAYAGSDWLLPHGLIGSESSSVVSAGDPDSSSWLSGVTAPPDREHSVRSSYRGDTSHQTFYGLKVAEPSYNPDNTHKSHPHGLYTPVL